MNKKLAMLSVLKVIVFSACQTKVVLAFLLRKLEAEVGF